MKEFSGLDFDIISELNTRAEKVGDLIGQGLPDHEIRRQTREDYKWIDVVCQSEGYKPETYRELYTRSVEKHLNYTDDEDK